jgi:hypothetical protein
VKLADDQSGAFGSVSTLTASQKKARRNLLRHAKAARRKAKFVFTGQQTVLRSEFQVGDPASRTLAATLDRSRKTLAAARKYTAEFAARGWPPTSIDQLQLAVDTLTAIDLTHEKTKDGKEGLTAQYIAAANLLYEQCITVQDAARIVYPNDETPAQPTTVEARARFLLGEFPPRESSAAAVVPIEPKGPTASTAPETPAVAVASQEEAKAA